jgi:hypothetical protein
MIVLGLIFGFCYDFFGDWLSFWEIWRGRTIYGFCYEFFVLRLLVVMKMMNKMLVVVVRSGLFEVLIFF